MRGNYPDALWPAIGRHAEILAIESMLKKNLATSFVYLVTLEVLSS